MAASVPAKFADTPATSLYYDVFAALLVLLAATVGVAEIDLGKANFPVAVLIATLKASQILRYFMHVRYSRALVWAVAGAGFFWLAILFSLTFGDYLTRETRNEVAPPTRLRS
jgi:cytochrome c oxidase subunit 4